MPKTFKIPLSTVLANDFGEGELHVTLIQNPSQLGAAVSFDDTHISYTPPDAVLAQTPTPDAPFLSDLVQYTVRDSLNRAATAHLHIKIPLKVAPDVPDSPLKAVDDYIEAGSTATIYWVPRMYLSGGRQTNLRYFAEVGETISAFGQTLLTVTDDTTFGDLFDAFNANPVLQEQGLRAALYTYAGYETTGDGGYPAWGIMSRFPLPDEELATISPSIWRYEVSQRTAPGPLDRPIFVKFEILGNDSGTGITVTGTSPCTNGGTVTRLDADTLAYRHPPLPELTIQQGPSFNPSGYAAINGPSKGFGLGTDYLPIGSLCFMTVQDTGSSNITQVRTPSSEWTKIADATAGNMRGRIYWRVVTQAWIDEMAPYATYGQGSYGQYDYFPNGSTTGRMAWTIYSAKVPTGYNPADMVGEASAAVFQADTSTVQKRLYISTVKAGMLETFPELGYKQTDTSIDMLGKTVLTNPYYKNFTDLAREFASAFVSLGYRIYPVDSTGQPVTSPAYEDRIAIETPLDWPLSTSDIDSLPPLLFQGLTTQVVDRPKGVRWVSEYGRMPRRGAFSGEMYLVGYDWSDPIVSQYDAFNGTVRNFPWGTFATHSDGFGLVSANYVAGANKVPLVWTVNEASRIIAFYFTVAEPDQYDTFTYEITDASGQKDTATVRVHLNETGIGEL